jgi:Flp pilus assembly protein TadD
MRSDRFQYVGDSARDGQIPIQTVDSVELIAAEFAAGWQTQRPPTLAAFVRIADGRQRIELLQQLISIDLEQRIKGGEQALLEDYLAEFPELEETSAARALANAERRIRMQYGQPVDIHEDAARVAQNPMTDEPRVSSAPLASDGALARIRPGWSIGDYHIKSTLGRGRRSCVYLAREAALDRLVVLKITPAVGNEGRTLAQLDHPNVVPVYRQSQIGDYHLLAMRYTPGVTLDKLIALRQGIDVAGFRGRDLLASIDAETSDQSVTCHTTTVNSPREHLRFVPLVCELVLDVAQGLRHAHSQGFLHRDVKPANILVDRRGVAQLMDFDVAASADPDQQTGPFGGTPGYMAPEQSHALSANEPSFHFAVDQRSDVYSLGVVFHELLTGFRPRQLQYAAPSTVRGPYGLHTTAGMTAGLESIVRRCLMSEPGQRYQAAGELVADLQRFLEHRPLAFADDPSSWERIRKRVQRHPRVVAVTATICVLLAAAIGVKTWSDFARLERAVQLTDELETRVADSRGSVDLQQTALRLVELRGLLATGPIDLTRLWHLQRQQLADRFDALVRSLVEMRPQPVAGASFIDLPLGARTARTDAELLQKLGVLESRLWYETARLNGLDPITLATLLEDVSERLVRIAVEGAATEASVGGGHLETRELIVRIPPGQRKLAIVRELERAGGAQQTAEVSGLARVAQTEWELYVVGALAVERGLDDLAIDCLSRSVKARNNGQAPRWRTHFLLGLAYQRVGRLEQAIARYRYVVGLRDDYAEAFHNLGLASAGTGDTRAATAYLERAARLDPSSGPIQANLGVARLGCGDSAGAIEALDRAAQLNFRNAEVLMNRAAARLAAGDRAGAMTDLRDALRLEPENDVVHSRWEQLRKSR